MQLPLGQAKCPSSHFCPWVTSRGSNTASSQVFISGSGKSFPENKTGLGSSRVCAICTFVRPLTLAVGLVGVVAAVVGAVADPRRVDAQRGGVAADEILLLDPQHEEVRAVAVVCEQANKQHTSTTVKKINGSSAWVTSGRLRRLIGRRQGRAASVFTFSFCIFLSTVTAMQNRRWGRTYCSLSHPRRRRSR